MTLQHAQRSAPRSTPADRLAALWSDTAWPVLAGALSAAGLIGWVRMYGLLGSVMVFLGLWTFAAFLLYGTCMESGLTWVRALRLGFCATHVMVVFMGLHLLFPVAGLFATAAAALTSPAVVERLLRLRRRALVATTPQPSGVRLDQSTVDRIFAQIVAASTEDQTSGPEPP